MSKELVISANRHETRVALIEDDQLCEVYFQRANEYSLAGSIHKGRVTRVLPGMQSAFVDLGLERDTFLYVSDFLEEHEDFDRVTGDERPAREDRGREERGREERGRDDRGRDRDRRPAQTPPPEVRGESAIAEGAPSEARPVETSANAPAVQAPGERPPDRGDDRGGRGRRSRRRRNRGRGFPDSKYAGAPGESNEGESAEPVPAPRDPSTPPPLPPHAFTSAPVPASDEHPPLILPGESLAKYRGAPASEHAPPAQESAVNGSVIAPAETHFKDVVAEDAASDTAIENEFDEPIHYPPENAIPDAPAHTPEAVVAAESVIAAPAGIAGEAVAEVVDEEEDAAEIEESEAAAGPVVAPMLDEEEDRDIQEMILSHAEGLTEALDEAIEESEEAAGGAGEGAEAAPEGSEDPASGAAAVRERGGRYPHRVSRRMRRRGGRGPGGGPDQRDQRDQQRDQRGPDRGPSGPDRERTVSRPASPAGSSIPSGGQPSISDLVKEGQEIIVQIAKEPLGQKGARITSHIALPGRYVVFMPTLEHMGVSRKIASDDERLRLKRILQGRRPGPVGGFITRTAAEGRSEDEIAADMAFLYNLWMDIRNKAEKRPAPMLLHHDLDIVQRILRDQLGDSFKAIWIDNEDTYESVLRFVERFQPALVGKVKLYTREAPIFDAFNVTSELEKALRPKVWLKSGGFIVINQTEALVAIDVNTGKYVGKTNRLEDTIVKTNTEAIKEIVRQVRLRDLGGIIVIDFIDMDERKNRQKVMQALEEAMRSDRAPYKILQFNDFGLVAITRKRVKQSLERTLCSPCPHCDGAGYIKSVQTVVSEILTEARKMASSVEGKDVMLRVHPDVAKVLKSHQNKYLEELEEVLRRPVLVKSDAQLHHEKFDLA
jgi:ribonuclease G